jgi:hypothetical protein
MNVTITGTSLIRAEDYALVNTALGWQPITCCSVAHQFTGGFDSAPDIGSAWRFAADGYGESLVGSYNAGSFVIGSNKVLSTFGFRIATLTNSIFNVTIDLFGSANGTGSYEQLTLSNLSGGGNCAGLLTFDPHTGTPTPCNNAPFVYVTTTSAVRSFSIATTDSTGFYIDALDVFDPVPEPATMLITGGGLMTLAYFIRRRRTTAARQ